MMSTSSDYYIIHDITMIGMNTGLKVQTVRLKIPEFPCLLGKGKTSYAKENCRFEHNSMRSRDTWDHISSEVNRYQEAAIVCGRGRRATHSGRERERGRTWVFHKVSGKHDKQTKDHKQNVQNKKRDLPHLVAICQIYVAFKKSFNAPHQIGQPGALPSSFF